MNAVQSIYVEQATPPANDWTHFTAADWAAFTADAWLTFTPDVVLPFVIQAQSAATETP